MNEPSSTIQKSNVALSSLICGIISLLLIALMFLGQFLFPSVIRFKLFGVSAIFWTQFLFGIIALILGIFGLVIVNKNNLSGKGFAIAGILIGVVCTLFPLILVYYFITHSAKLS